MEAATTSIPYCGAPPVPGALLDRWNADPILIAVLVGLAAVHLWRVPDRRGAAALGWAVAAFAFLSPRTTLPACRGFRSGSPQGFAIHPGSYDCPSKEIEARPDVRLGDTICSTQEVTLR